MAETVILKMECKFKWSYSDSFLNFYICTFESYLSILAKEIQIEIDSWNSFAFLVHQLNQNISD